MVIYTDIQTGRMSFFPIKIFILGKFGGKEQPGEVSSAWRRREYSFSSGAARPQGVSEDSERTRPTSGFLRNFNWNIKKKLQSTREIMEKSWADRTFFDELVCHKGLLVRCGALSLVRLL